MGFLDRLRGRGRYVAGTTPESVDELPEPAPEWSGTAPPETGWVEGRTERVEREVVETRPWSGEQVQYVTAEDFTAAYGLAGLTTVDDPPVDDVVTHTVAAQPSGTKLEVFVCDHRAYPGMAADDETSWRERGPVTELTGLGDSAFVTEDGTVFARVGDDWTVQVATGDWNPPVEQTVQLMRRILARLATAPPPDPVVFEETVEVEFDDEPAEWRPAPAPESASRPGRRRRVAVGALLALAAVGMTLARTADSGDSDSRAVSLDSTYDILAEIAAEPDRTLNAQGVGFQMTDYQPMQSGLCPAVSSCLRATRADFDVVGRPMISRTWLLVFPSDQLANTAAQSLRDQPGLLGADPPAGSFSMVFNNGRWVQPVRLTGTNGAAVPVEDDTRAVLRGIGALSAESAIFDSMRRLDD